MTVKELHDWCETHMHKGMTNGTDQQSIVEDALKYQKNCNDEVRISRCTNSNEILFLDALTDEHRKTFEIIGTFYGSRILYTKDSKFYENGNS